MSTEASAEGKDRRVLDADLLIVVERHVVEGSKVRLDYTLTGTDLRLGLRNTNLGVSKPVADLDEYFRKIMEELKPPRPLGKQPVGVEALLAAKGAKLSRDLLPRALVRKLWEVRGAIRSVQILSEVPGVPWELMRLEGQEDERLRAGPFWGQLWELAHWFSEDPAIVEIPLGTLALTVPSGYLATQDSAREAEFLEGLADRWESVEVTPVKLQEIPGALTSAGFDGWHFVGHGSVLGLDPDWWPLRIGKGRGLRPEDLRRDAVDFGGATPLVFLNACHAGQIGMSLAGIGGWAQQVIKAGGSALLAPRWAVAGEVARVFAEEFYRHFMAGEPIARSVWRARHRVRFDFPGDSGWLAYTLYSHPLAVRVEGRSAIEPIGSPPGSPQGLTTIPKRSVGGGAAEAQVHERVVVIVILGLLIVLLVIYLTSSGRWNSILRGTSSQPVIPFPGPTLHDQGTAPGSLSIPSEEREGPPKELPRWDFVYDPTQDRVVDTAEPVQETEAR